MLAHTTSDEDDEDTMEANEIQLPPWVTGDLPPGLPPPPWISLAQPRPDGHVPMAPKASPRNPFPPPGVSEGSSAERQHTSARAHPVPEAVQLPPLCYFYAKIACQHLRQECSACARCQLNLGAGVVVGYSLGTSVLENEDFARGITIRREHAQR